MVLETYSLFELIEEPQLTLQGGDDGVGPWIFLPFAAFCSKGWRENETKDMVELGQLLYEVYSTLDVEAHIPDKYLKDLSSAYTTIVNPDFLIWKSKEKALLTFLSSTLTPSILALIVGCSSTIEV